MRKYYEVGSTPYWAEEGKTVEVVFAKQLEEGNVYLIRFTDFEERLNWDDDSVISVGFKEEEYYEKVFEHHKLGDPILFNSKEDYEQYKADRIFKEKTCLLKNDFWIKYLYSIFTGNTDDKEEKEAMKQIIKEKLGVNVEDIEMDCQMTRNDPFMGSDD